MTATVRLLTDPRLDGVSGVRFDGLRESARHPQANDTRARRRVGELSDTLCAPALTG